MDISSIRNHIFANVPSFRLETALSLICKAVDDPYNTTVEFVTLWDSDGANTNCCFTLPRFHRSTFTWSPEGIIVSQGPLAADVAPLLVRTNGPIVERNRWKFWCIPPHQRKA